MSDFYDDSLTHLVVELTYIEKVCHANGWPFADLLRDALTCVSGSPLLVLGSRRRRASRPGTELDLLTIDETAELLAVSRGSVRAYMDNGELPVVRIARSIRFDPADVAVFIAAHRDGDGRAPRQRRSPKRRSRLAAEHDEHDDGEPAGEAVDGGGEMVDG